MGKVNPFKFVATIWILSILSGCSTLPVKNAASQDVGYSDTEVTVYIVRRGWHTDVGFFASDLQSPLDALRDRFVNPSYILFGFGDRRYLTHHGSKVPALISAVLPGPGLVLVTSLTNTPAEAFGASNVVALRISTAQVRGLQAFLSQTVSTPQRDLQPVSAGPYEGSEYYSAVPRYSGFHTCNTWTAEALQAAGLPVHAHGVVFASQVWSEVRHLQRTSARSQERSLSPSG